jgi:deoxycytidine triphosphate deaminase
MTDDTNNQEASRFAETDQEAEKRFNQFRSRDPFPSIPSALLNSADIVDYVAATGMIFPFDGNEENFKSASYRVDILGNYVYWNEKTKKTSSVLERGQELTLKPNSIVFVTVEPMLRIPNYIALRFNLQISHVYKGLLVGTGPLVDPGFIGKLSLPLHNLTANEYTLKGGDPIIWMEFTKLSPNKEWTSDNDAIARSGVFIGFPQRKNRLRGIDNYLEKAVGRDRKVISSIPYAVEKAYRRAEEAAEASIEARENMARTERQVNDNLIDIKVEYENLSTTVTKDIEVIKAQTKADLEIVTRRVTFLSAIASIIVILGSVFGLILPSYNLVKTTTDSLVRTELNLKDLGDNRVKELESKVEALEKQISTLESKLSQSPASASSSGDATRTSRRATVNQHK